ncbi:MAG: zinc-ribbon domain containing protein [Acidobacteria bacterium]|nr:zinc-ribbon domain containing protein [Acidobacteriota bacterium]
MSKLEFEDQQKTCVDCGKDFTWTAGEQEGYHGLRLSDPPKVCKDCRQAKKERHGDQRGGNR